MILKTRGGEPKTLARGNPAHAWDSAKLAIGLMV
jgi:hypothetical protein